MGNYEVEELASLAIWGPFNECEEGTSSVIVYEIDLSKVCVSGSDGFVHFLWIRRVDC